jgi:uncharacterized membrane protein YhaH (DUF805 family)
MPGDLGPLAPLNMPIRRLLFSFRGRIPRSIWWASSAILNLAWLLLFALVINLSEAQPDADRVLAVLQIGMMALVIWTNVALHFKRWQDTGHDGWNCSLALIPYLGWFIGVTVCGFAPGTEGPNKYGPDPLAATAPESNGNMA